MAFKLILTDGGRYAFDAIDNKVCLVFRVDCDGVIIANLHCALFPIVVEVHSILAVPQLVFSYPLGVITSPLGRSTRHFGVLAAQVNLVPLIHIVDAS